MYLSLYIIFLWSRGSLLFGQCLILNMSQVQIPLEEAYGNAEFFIEWLKIGQQHCPTLFEPRYLCVVECLTQLYISTFSNSALAKTSYHLTIDFKMVQKKKGCHVFRSILLIFSQELPFSAPRKSKYTNQWTLVIDLNPSSVTKTLPLLACSDWAIDPDKQPIQGVLLSFNTSLPLSQF